MSLLLNPTPASSLMGSGSTSSLWHPADRLELQSIDSESDPELRAEALLGMAGRLEQAGRLEAAGEIYAAVAGGVTNPVGTVPPLNQETREGPLQLRAQGHLDAILGRGALGPRVEFLLRNLAQQAAEPSAIFAMGAAGAVFRMTRLAMLSRLAGASNPGFMTQLLGAGRLASVAGFAAEAPSFALAARLGSEALGRSQDWSGTALARDFASSYLLLGGLRVAGWASGAAYRGFAGPVGAEHVQPLRALFQQGGMLSGIMLGHALEQWTGLRRPQDGATTLVDSLAMLLQFNVAGRLTRHAFGPRWTAWERGLDLHAEALTQRPPPGRSLLPRPRLEGDLVPAVAGPSHETLRPELPSRMFMTGRGRGDGSWSAELLRASNLRAELSPADAWRRRAEHTAEYLARLKDLPTGRREVLQEMQQGLELLGQWAEGKDSFRRAIGFRHYAELWNLLAQGWNHTVLNAVMTDSLQRHISRHRSLLDTEGNPRFLQTALEASRQIARIYTHSEGALLEGSPRERELTQALRGLLATLRLGASAPRHFELREKYLEAFHDTLNNTATDRLEIAREAHAGLRLAREWMMGADSERAEIGRKYFPSLWQRLAERGQPGFKDSLLNEIQEEIVFLQRHTAPHGTERETLLAALRAFPYYSELVFNIVGTQPGNVFALTNTFLSQARVLRPWISEHGDSQVRAACASSYLRLMTQLHDRAAELSPNDGRFPVSISRQVEGELSQALEIFAQRWKTREAELLLPALKDYLELAMLLPPRPEFSHEVLAETNLKPLMNLQYHPDPRVRPFIEEILVKLLHRFSETGPGGGTSN